MAKDETYLRTVEAAVCDLTVISEIMQTLAGASADNEDMVPKTWLFFLGGCVASTVDRIASARG
jgi:hypothetical protein